MDRNAASRVEELYKARRHRRVQGGVTSLIRSLSLHPPPTPYAAQHIVEPRLVGSLGPMGLGLEFRPRMGPATLLFAAQFGMRLPGAKAEHQ